MKCVLFQNLTDVFFSVGSSFYWHFSFFLLVFQVWSLSCCGFEAWNFSIPKPGGRSSRMGHVRLD